ILQDEKEELNLTMPNPPAGMFFESYQLYFAEGAFYFPKREQIPIIKQIVQLDMNENINLPVSKEQTDVFLSEVLPSLEKIGDIEIDETIAEDIIQVPLRAKLYLEIREDNWIAGNLEYHYGPYEVNPFTNEKSNEAFIIRDVEKEHQVMRLVEHANFK